LNDLNRSQPGHLTPVDYCYDEYIRLHHISMIPLYEVLQEVSNILVCCFFDEYRHKEKPFGEILSAAHIAGHFKVIMDLSSYKKYPKILVAVDCIIFGFDGTNVKALVIKRGFEPEKGKWSLMGGFVGTEENAEDAASRVLYKLTGMRNVYMEQLYTFSDMDRDSAARVVSIAFFALIKLSDYSEELQLKHKAKWFPLDKLPPLIFDHSKMVHKAIEKIRKKLSSYPIGFELLPQKFTLPQLQSLYEAVYGTEFDKRNFAKRMLSLGILNKLDEKEKDSSKKGAFYYVFDKVKYQKISNADLKFI
jgi:8-oxo-dGTP diphosphatase